MTLLELFKLLRKHLALVVVLPVVLAIATAGFSWGLMQNQYTATVSVYVLTAKDDASSSSTTAYNDLTASQLMANDIATLAKSETVQKRTAEALGMSSLSGYKISVEAGTTTRVISISVTAGKPMRLPSSPMRYPPFCPPPRKASWASRASTWSTRPRFPRIPRARPRAMYTAVAFLAGIFLAVAIVVVLDMLNTRVRNPEEAEELLGIPVIGRIPTIKG